MRISTLFLQEYTSILRGYFTRISKLFKIITLKVDIMRIKLRTLQTLGNLATLVLFVDLILIQTPSVKLNILQVSVSYRLKQSTKIWADS